VVRFQWPRFLRWREGRKRTASSRAFDVLLQKALFAHLAQDQEATEQALTEAVRIDSDATDAYVALCRFYRGRGEIGRAIRLHQNLLLRKDLAPRDRQTVLLELAQDFNAGGFLRRAVASFEEVLAHEPRHTVALRALVQLHTDLQDFTRAIVLEKRLARLEKRDATAEAALWVLCGEHERDHGRAHPARKAAKTAIRRDSGCAAAHRLLGQLYADRGRNKAALSAWSKVPRLDRELAVAVYPRVEAAYAAIDRARDYEAYLRGLIQVEPDDPGAMLALARYLSSRGDADLALIELKRLLDQQPRHREARVVLGRCLIAAGRDDEIASAYADLLDLFERRSGFEDLA